LPTTTPSSRQRRANARPRALRGPGLLLGAALFATGCATAPRTTPRELFQLAPESAAHKATQTRHFETRDSDELLSASAAVLQDLGFQVTESDRDLGFLRAAKERSAREYGQEIRRGIVAFLTTLLSAFGGGNAVVVLPVDLHQQINASLIAQPSREREGSHEVRIVFYRLVWKGDGSSGDTRIPPGEQRMLMIRDAEIYQRFFGRLQKSVFLESEKL